MGRPDERWPGVRWLVGAVVAVVLVTVASSAPVPVAERAPTSPWDLGIDVPETPELPELPDAGERDLPDSEAPAILSVVLEVLAVGVLAAIVLVIGAAVLRAWRNRPHLRWRGRRRAEDFDVLEDLAAAVAADAPAQRRALATGTPRNAIVACWLRLEQMVADTGVARHPADTPAEFTARVLSQRHVDGTAIQLLAALYREARFSDHEMGESERQAATLALDSLHTELGRSRPPAPVS